MGDSLTKNIANRIYGLVIYQIAGGIFGIGLIVWLITQLELTNFVIFLLLIALLLYSYSIYCGIILLNRRVLGINHSLINQYFQLISFSILGYGFTYISGLYFSIGVDFTDSIVFKFNLGVSSWQININRDTDILYVNLNLVSLFLIVFINNLKKKIRKMKPRNR